MKKNFLLLLILVFTGLLAQAQDTLYIYKGGAVVTKRAITQIDSISFTAPSPSAGTVQDIDGNYYHTVTIGTQTWMVENLKTTKFRNGESIPNISDNTAWSALTTAAMCDYDNNPNNGAVFGHLYNWYAVNDQRNIAPAGWHIPSTDEWATFENYLISNGFNYDGSFSGNKFAKAIASTNYWTLSSGPGAPGNSPANNNSTQFSSMPGGMRYGNSGVYGNSGTGSYMWTSVLVTDAEANYRAIFYGYNFFNSFQSSMKHGFAVRCIKSDVPVVTTNNATSITINSAISGGNITSDGNDPVIARGVCWNTTGNPTLNDNKTTNGSGKGTFNSPVAGLIPGTTYYLCAYATNSAGTAYGAVVTFKTLATVPTVSTSQVSDIKALTATCGGNITTDGGAAVTAKGVCWSTTENPTISDSKTADGTGNGAFVSSVTGLTAGTKYYVRAYATNEKGTSYGTQVSFTTLNVPVVAATTAATAITATTAQSGGEVTADGGATISARGICWSTNENPTITDNKTSDGTGLGLFNSSISGLTAGTKYYVRAYATNEVGTSYGTQVSFTTLNSPVVSTNAITEITVNSAKSGGVISSDGGSEITAKGVCWSTSENPTINDNKSLDGTGSGQFNSAITGLVAGTKYYVRAYATNAIGTSYGAQLTFTTPDSPVLTTVAVSEITTTTVKSGGTITTDGGAAITAKGVCWSTSPQPVIANNENKTNDGTGSTSFTSSITALLPATTYYLRAYATNSTGTAYGNEVTFTTLSVNP